MDVCHQGIGGFVLLFLLDKLSDRMYLVARRKESFLGGGGGLYSGLCLWQTKVNCAKSHCGIHILESWCEGKRRKGKGRNSDSNNRVKPRTSHISKVFIPFSQSDTDFDLCCSRAP